MEVIKRAAEAVLKVTEKLYTYLSSSEIWKLGSRNIATHYLSLKYKPCVSAKMSARYVSSKLIQAIQKGTKSIQVEYVNKTDAWVRLDNFPATSLQSDIVTVVKENIDKLNPETAIVAMKYATSVFS